MKGVLIYDPIFLKHNFYGHPENSERLKAFLKPLKEFKNIEVIRPENVSEDLLFETHSRSYVELIKNYSQKTPVFLDSDTYMVESSLDAALKAAGALETAVNLTVKENIKIVICAVRPPGHHAEKEKAMGFCIFNNVAIGAQKALNSGMERVFIIDFDAHHGNGTQNIFYENQNVFYFSTHQYPLFPGTGLKSENNEHILNFPLPPGSNDEDFIPIYERDLSREISNFRPEILIVSAGFDLHMNDPLAQLNVSDRGIKTILDKILENSYKLNIPVIFSLEGGYNLSVLEKAGRILLSFISPENSGDS